MSVEAYLNPDFTVGKKLLFLLVTAALLGIGIGFIYLVSLLVLGRDIPVGNRKQAVLGALEDKVQRFFEMIIAGTSVMSFSCAYVIINHVNTLVQSGVAGNLTPVEQRLIEAWAEGKDFVLLLLICLSCVINTILDSLIIPLKKLSKAEKATMRMLAMFYFGLMIGRFVYFDASFKDFLVALKNMFFNLPYMALNLILTGALCAFGFGVGYFLERNYFIMGIFYTHLFMLVCIFVIHLVWMIVRCAGNKDKE